jgi:cobalt/nickel transport protein
MSRRTFFLSVLVVALLVAGVLSYYASSHPDGLEYVAGKAGFLDSADESLTAGSPFADYGNAGGVVGVVLVLLLATGLAYALRRRAKVED